jgi:hypothetical protein
VTSEATQGVADDVAAPGPIGGRVGFDRGAQLGVEPNRDDLGVREPIGVVCDVGA